MRNLLTALVVVGLLAAPSLGVINVKITADETNLTPGATTTVRIWGQGTDAGLYSLAGDVVASGDAGVLTSTAGSLAFSPLFHPTSLFAPNPGAAGANGGWNGFGTMQTTWDTPNPDLGRDDYIEVASYTVAAGNQGTVSLSFVAQSISGYKPVETNKALTLGAVTPVAINVVPEPVTMALLAIGGLVAVRRRR